MANLHRREVLTGLGLLGGSLLLPRSSAARATAPFPELTVSGSPGAIGLARGRRFRNQIRGNIAFYLSWLGEHTKASAKEIRSAALGFVKPTRQYLPALMEEIEGIAKGSGFTLAEIMAINARTDLLVKAKPSKHAALNTKPGCTALALRGNVGGKTHLALGQNWDWRPQMAKRICLLRVRPKAGPAVVTFTEAGMIGKIGFNTHRLGVCLNFLGHKTETAKDDFGVPIHLLLRGVMSCRSLEEADAMLRKLPRCASANFLVGEHGKRGPRAWNFELTPKKIGIRKLVQHSLVHTNHFLDPELAKGCSSGRGISTMNRFRVASKLTGELANKIADPAARMRQMLRDREGAPYSISRTPGEKSKSMTLAGIVMDLSRNRLHLAKGPTHANRWVTVRGA